MTDDELLDRLAVLWRDHDPMPAGLADRMARYARAEVALLATDWDHELMRLVDRSTELAGARAAGTTLTLQFATDDVDLLVRLAGDPAGTGTRLDGWIVPSLAARVRLLRLDDDATASGTAEAGDDGRFEMGGLASGSARLHLEPLDDAQPGFVTPTFEI